MDLLPFVPVIEPPGTEGAFLTEDPKKLINEGNFTKVPLIMGATDLEGAVFYIGGQGQPFFCSIPHCNNLNSLEYKSNAKKIEDEIKLAVASNVRMFHPDDSRVR